MRRKPIVTIKAIPQGIHVRMPWSQAKVFHDQMLVVYVKSEESIYKARMMAVQERINYSLIKEVQLKFFRAGIVEKTAIYITLTEAQAIALHLYMMKKVVSVDVYSSVILQNIFENLNRIVA